MYLLNTISHYTLQNAILTLHYYFIQDILGSGVPSCFPGGLPPGAGVEKAGGFIPIRCAGVDAVRAIGSGAFISACPVATTAGVCLYQAGAGASCVVAAEAFEFSSEGSAAEGFQENLHSGVTQVPGADYQVVAFACQGE